MRALPRALLPVLLFLPLLAACGGGGGPDAADEQGPPTWFVDSASGDDGGPGTSDEPFRTITHALSIAVEGEVVRVRAGTYAAASGERFPLRVPAGVELVGRPSPLLRGAGVLVEGVGLAPPDTDPDFAILATIVPFTRSTVAGLTLVNPTDMTSPVSRTVVVAAAHSDVRLVACTIRKGKNDGIRFGNGSRRIEVRSCDVTGAGNGLAFAGGGLESIVEQCRVVENVTGVAYLSPAGGGDLGGGGLGGSLGGNTFSKNFGSDVFVFVPIVVTARDNVWDGFPVPTEFVGDNPLDGIDVWRYEQGAIVDTTGARSLNPPLGP